MRRNLADWERVLRMAIGAALMALGVVLFRGSDVVAVRLLSGAVVLLGLDLAVTGVSGYCPLYHKFGWRTADRRTES